MSKRAEQKAEEHIKDMHNDYQSVIFYSFIDGYEQAEKDVWDRIEKYLSDCNPNDYATAGWILKNLEEYKKKIMEEEL